MHNHILHEFEFWPNGTTDYGVSCPDGSQVSERCPLGYLFLFFSCYFYNILYIFFLLYFFFFYDLYI